MSQTSLVRKNMVPLHGVTMRIGRYLPNSRSEFIDDVAPGILYRVSWCSIANGLMSKIEQLLSKTSQTLGRQYAKFPGIVAGTSFQSERFIP